jgi:two-component system sensor kinase FixL
MADTIHRSPRLEPNALLQLAFWRRIAWQYGLAIVVIAVGVAIKLAFDSVLRGEASYVLFVPAVLIASALGGWGPGMLATALGLALGLFLLQRPASWQQPTS